MNRMWRSYLPLVAVYCSISLLLTWLYYSHVNAEGFNEELIDIPHHFRRTKDIGAAVNGMPLVIYESWATRKIPKGMKKNLDFLRDVNPEFDVYVYSDAECEEFIKDNFSNDVLRAFKSLIPGAYKSDLWRYCVLYVKGGVYMDIKFHSVPNRPLLPIISSWFCGKNSEDVTCRPENIVQSIQDIAIQQQGPLNTHAIFVQDGKEGTCYPIGVYNGFMASMPKNPIFKQCIDDIVESWKKKAPGLNALDLTGPCLLGRYITAHVSGEYPAKMPFKYSNDWGPGITFNGDIVMQHYSTYRTEQKTHQRTTHYAELWGRGSSAIWK